jgi:ferredoxin
MRGPVPQAIKKSGEFAMKVKVDPSICQGHGMCFLYCPDIFQLSDEDGHAYVASEDVPPDLEEAVELAQRSCPEQAISLS